jgi:hypothetical protein
MLPNPRMTWAGVYPVPGFLFKNVAKIATVVRTGCLVDGYRAKTARGTGGGGAGVR